MASVSFNVGSDDSIRVYRAPASSTVRISVDAPGQPSRDVLSLECRDMATADMVERALSGGAGIPEGHVAIARTTLVSLRKETAEVQQKTGYLFAHVLDLTHGVTK